MMMRFAGGYCLPWTWRRKSGFGWCVCVCVCACASGRRRTSGGRPRSVPTSACVCLRLACPPPRAHLSSSNPAPASCTHTHHRPRHRSHAPFTSSTQILTRGTTTSAGHTGSCHRPTSHLHSTRPSSSSPSPLTEVAHTASSVPDSQAFRGSRLPSALPPVLLSALSSPSLPHHSVRSAQRLCALANVHTRSSA